MIKSIVVSKAKGFRVKKEVLLISTKSVVGSIITKEGLIEEDKFIYYIQEALENNNFDRFLNQNFFNRKIFYNNNGNNYPQIFDYIVEEIVFNASLNIKILFGLFKNYSFSKKYLNAYLLKAIVNGSKRRIKRKKYV